MDNKSSGVEIAQFGKLWYNLFFKNKVKKCFFKKSQGNETLQNKKKILEYVLFTNPKINNFCKKANLSIDILIKDFL